MTRFVFALVAAAALASAAAGGTGAAFPKKIDLPDGFQPEGIATAGERFYVGSIPSGAVYSGSLRTGKGAILVPATSGRAAIGIGEDRGRLFVAGGPTGDGYVYDARTGNTIATYDFASGTTFINDVAVTRNAAWFTDSFNPVLYRVPLRANGRPGPQSGVQTINLTGDYVHQQGSFNVNGIDATANGKTLVIVQSGTGTLFTVTRTGVTRTIALNGGANVSNGDGILLLGRTLYVVQNQLNQIAKIALAANLRTGRIVKTVADPMFDVPTTVDAHGKRLYVVNARFGTPGPGTADYWLTRIAK